MRWLNGFLWLLIAGGSLALIASFPVEAQYQAKAKLVQRVQQDAGADLFGEVGTPIGSPQMIIIEDPKAFLGKRDASGAELVSENYLKEKSIYPLQLQTVKFVLTNARLASGGALLVGLIGLALARRKQKLQGAS